MNTGTAAWLAAVGATTICLAVGFLMAGRWLGAGLALAVLAFWLLARRWQGEDLFTTALGASVCLAGYGVLTQAAPVLMLAGSALALAAWDLGLLDLKLAASSQPELAAGLATRHYVSLALAVGLGLTLALAGRMARLQTSFLPMVVAVGVAFYCLDQVGRRIR